MDDRPDRMEGMFATGAGMMVRMLPTRPAVMLPAVPGRERPGIGTMLSTLPREFGSAEEEE